MAFQTQSSSPRSTVQMQINLLLRAIICTLYLVRGSVGSGVGGEGVRLDFEKSFTTPDTICDWRIKQ